MAQRLTNARVAFYKKVMAAYGKMVRGYAFNDRTLFDDGAEDLQSAVNEYFNQGV